SRIRIHEDAMGIIDVKNIARSQLIEDIQPDSLHGPADDLIAKRINLDPGARVNGDYLCVEPMVRDCFSRELCRITGTDLQKISGLLYCYQTIQRNPVQSRHPSIYPTGFSGRRAGRLPPRNLDKTFCKSQE